MVLESWAYHRTLTGVHPEPCLMCLNQLSEADIIESNSHFLVRHVSNVSAPLWRTDLLSWLMGLFTRK